MVLTTKGKVTIALIIMAIVLVIGVAIYFISNGNSDQPDQATALVTIIDTTYQYLQII